MPEYIHANLERDIAIVAYAYSTQRSRRACPHTQCCPPFPLQAHLQHNLDTVLYGDGDGVHEVSVDGVYNASRVVDLTNELQSHSMHLSTRLQTAGAQPAVSAFVDLAASSTSARCNIQISSCRASICVSLNA